MGWCESDRVVWVCAWVLHSVRVLGESGFQNEHDMGQGLGGWGHMCCVGGQEGPGIEAQ